MRRRWNERKRGGAMRRRWNERKNGYNEKKME